MERRAFFKGLLASGVALEAIPRSVSAMGSKGPRPVEEQLGQLATPSAPKQASNSTAPPRAWTPPPPRPSGPRHLRASIRFMEDEDYRRQRLASFVLESLADAREATGSARAGAPEADELEEVGDVDGAGDVGGRPFDDVQFDQRHVLQGGGMKHHLGLVH